MTDHKGLPSSIALPDGRLVRGRGLRNPTPAGPAPDFGLYLGTHRLRGKHGTGITWPADWIDWPDFLLPRDRTSAVAKIRDLYERAGTSAVEVACGGGRGRTGTVVACLAILGGVAPRDAVAWTREHYDRHAVETPWQRRWVERFPG